jgi:hypothetical protein
MGRLVGNIASGTRGILNETTPANLTMEPQSSANIRILNIHLDHAQDLSTVHYTVSGNVINLGGGSSRVIRLNLTVSDVVNGTLYQTTFSPWPAILSPKKTQHSVSHSVQMILVHILVHYIIVYRLNPNNPVCLHLLLCIIFRSIEELC